MVVQGVLRIMFGLLLWLDPGTASLHLLMDSVIQVLATLEQKVPATEGSNTASVWLQSVLDSGLHDPLYRFLLEEWPLKPIELDTLLLTPELQDLAKAMAQHSVQSGQEYGVVLSPDGSTVAVQPLLMGLLVGLQGHRLVNLPIDNTVTPLDATVTLPDVEAMVPHVRATSPGFRHDSSDVTSPDIHSSLSDATTKSVTTVDSLLVLTLARDLGLTFLQDLQIPSHPGLGIDGCWNNHSTPQNFTLLGSEASLLTMAFLNGALDGIILGDYLSQTPEPRPPLSHLLREYYGAGVARDPRFRSNFRRHNGATLLSASTLTQQVWGALILLQRLESGHPQLQGMSQGQLAKIATHATKEFTEAFLGCPAIHPRCRWDAVPYQGTPTLLQLPLGFLYVHHTYVPAPPCTDFEQCTANMRSMQHFHQKTRGWDDIGYSFVVGSDGYVYEGRGWQWVGAHTRGHNSRGFGVALVGNYTAKLPAEDSLRTVREILPRCAVRAGLLRPDYVLLGHRQLVRTDCPGDALFNLLRTWPHFATNVKPRTAMRAPRRSRRELLTMIPPDTDLQ